MRLRYSFLHSYSFSRVLIFFQNNDGIEYYRLLYPELPVKGAFGDTVEIPAQSDPVVVL